MHGILRQAFDVAQRDHMAKARDAWPKAFAVGEYLVHAKKELLWFDTKAELQALLVEAEKNIAALSP